MPNFIALECIKCGGKLRVSDDRERFTCNFCGTEHLMKDGVVSLSPMMDVLKGVKGGVDKTAAELAIRRLRDDIASLQTQLDKIEQTKHRFENELSTLENDKNFINQNRELDETNAWFAEHGTTQLQQTKATRNGALWLGVGLIMFVATVFLCSQLPEIYSSLPQNTFGFVYLVEFCLGPLSLIVSVIGYIQLRRGFNRKEGRQKEYHEFLRVKQIRLGIKSDLENVIAAKRREIELKRTERDQFLLGVQVQQNSLEAEIKKKREELARHEQLVSGN